MTISMNVVGPQMAKDGRPETKKTKDERVIVSTDAEAQELSPAEKELEKVRAELAKLQEAATLRNRKIHYTVNQEIGKVIIKIIDSKTDKVIEEIPSVEMQRFQANFKVATGLFIDEKA